MVEVLDDSIMDIPPLNWDTEAINSFARSYDKQRDILFIYKTPKRPAVSFDVGGHFWIRIDPVSGEVLGLEFEDFEQVFLARYPELRLGWEKIKPRIIKRNNGVAEYLRLLLLSAQEILKEHPHQRGMATA